MLNFVLVFILFFLLLFSLSFDMEVFVKLSRSAAILPSPPFIRQYKYIYRERALTMIEWKCLVIAIGNWKPILSICLSWSHHHSFFLFFSFFLFLCSFLYLRFAPVIFFRYSSTLLEWFWGVFACACVRVCE